MASKTLFNTTRGTMAPATDVLNRGGGNAYALSASHALAQYAATGCFNQTFYASAENQMMNVLSLCVQLDAEFIAKTAVFARKRGFMKDMPAFLCAALSVHDKTWLRRVFHRVIDDGKMVRNFVQVMRSGMVGRKSLGTLPKKLVREWLDARSDEEVFRASVGQTPSLADIVKMVHPKPASQAREALYGYLLGRTHSTKELCALVRDFEHFKRSLDANVPDVPFLMLTGLPLLDMHWREIAKHASWQTTRMNLNTFARHNVFEDRKLTSMIADRLRDAAAVRKARAFPYQLMIASRSADSGVPQKVVNALEDAMEIAIENVPELTGQTYVLVDVSGSMSSPATGMRAGATTAVQCTDVASLMAAAIMRKNPQAEVIPFAEKTKSIHLSARDSVMTNARKLAALGGGGTNCSAPLKTLNTRKAEGSLVIYVSDNQSWVDARHVGAATETMNEWHAFTQRNPSAKMVCIDIQPYADSQAKERDDVMNVGGFSDQVFEAIATFSKGYGPDQWVHAIAATEV